MKVRLFIDSDTNYSFKDLNQAQYYANNLKVPYCILAIYPSTNMVSVYNTYVRKVEYFKSESQALKYIGSFL